MESITDFEYAEKLQDYKVIINTQCEFLSSPPPPQSALSLVQLELLHYSKIYLQSLYMVAVDNEHTFMKLVLCHNWNSTLVEVLLGSL
jgi:hypothetical protein